MTSIDTGLGALVTLLRFHGIGADPEQISHRFGAATIGEREIVRCAKELGLKSRAFATKWERLPRLALPMIAGARDGGFLILGRASAENALVQLPTAPRPQMMTRAE